jgi:hypothetical protein
MRVGALLKRLEDLGWWKLLGQEWGYGMCSSQEKFLERGLQWGGLSLG